MLTEFQITLIAIGSFTLGCIISALLGIELYKWYKKTDVK